MSQPTPPARVLAGRYHLRGELGRGGCAIVYEAFDLRLGCLVAIKVIKQEVSDPQASARLAREARAAASIQHPNVCGVLDTGFLEDGRPYLVMERLHGETLTDCLGRLQRLSLSDAIDMMLQLLSALDAVHAMGVIHRDVKPDNIFLVPRFGCGPLVKLIDFGMCYLAPSPWDAGALTPAGRVVGTPQYLAPEQVSGKRAFGAQIDLYAAGVILYEALSGDRAFSGNDAREVIAAVLVKDHAPLSELRPEIPTALDRVVARAMERQASARYASATDLQADLIRATRGAGGHGHGHGHATEAQRGRYSSSTRELSPAPPRPSSASATHPRGTPSLELRGSVRRTRGTPPAPCRVVASPQKSEQSERRFRDTIPDDLERDPWDAPTLEYRSA